MVEKKKLLHAALDATFWRWNGKKRGGVRNGRGRTNQKNVKIFNIEAGSRGRKAPQKRRLLKSGRPGRLTGLWCRARQNDSVDPRMIWKGNGQEPWGGSGRKEMLTLSPRFNTDQGAFGTPVRLGEQKGREKDG